MKFTVITVCYNSAEYIRTAITSVLSQDYSNFEFIIIDGGSTDRTVDIINEYVNTTTNIKLISENDNGIYDAMNKGIVLSTGDYISILNSDDFYSCPNVLSDVCNQIISHNFPDIVLSSIKVVSRDSLRFRRAYSVSSFSPCQLKYGFMPPHPGSFISKSVYINYGLFDTNYIAASDYDFFVKSLLVNNLSFIKYNNCTVIMRDGGLSSSGMKSYLNATSAIVSILRSHKIKFFKPLILLRLPFKFILMIFSRFVHLFRG